MVDFLSYLVSSSPSPFLVWATPIVWVRSGASFFLDTWPKLVQLGVPTPDFESGVPDRKRTATFSCWPQWQDHWVGPEVFVMPASLDFSRFLSLFLQFSCQFSELPDILLIHSSLAILLLHYSYFWYPLMSHFRTEAFNGIPPQCRSISPPITNFFFLQNTYISMIKHSWKWLFD